MATLALTSRHVAVNIGHMAIRPLHLRPVPRADELLDAHGDVWRQLTYSTDRYDSLWENTRTETGATWAVLDSGAYGAVVVLAGAVAA